MNDDLSEVLDTLERMLVMWSMMMEKVNHKRSFYDAATIKEMNEAPLQARRVLVKHDRHPRPEQNDAY